MYLYISLYIRFFLDYLGLYYSIPPNRCGFTPLVKLKVKLKKLYCIDVRVAFEGVSNKGI